MTELTLSDAWRLWFAGPLSPSTTIFHLELYVWARLGKVLQFLGAATILAEIIGTERLRILGASLRDIFSLRRAGAAIRDVWIFFKCFGNDPWDKKSKEQFIATKSSNYYTALILLGTIILLGNLWTTLNWWQLLFSALAAIIVLSIAGFGIVVTGGLICWLNLLGLAVIVEAVAWLLEQPRIDRWIKLGAFFALIVGFHFDFLAS